MLTPGRFRAYPPFMPESPENAKKVVAELRQKVSALHRDLEMVWAEQLPLEMREEELKREIDKYERSISLLGRHYGIESTKRPSTKERARQHDQIRAVVRRSIAKRGERGVTIPQAIEAVLAKASRSLSAEEILAEIRAQKLVVAEQLSVEVVRTNLSRYAENCEWVRSTGERPARWHVKRTPEAQTDVEKAPEGKAKVP